jgi:hypothetical protein
MNRPRLFRLALAPIVVTVVVTVLAVMAPTAAEAASYHHTDATRDVVSVIDDDAGSATTPETSRDDGDILTSAVAHGPRRVTMALHLGALEESGDLVVHYFSIATSRHKVRTFTIVAEPGHWQGSVRKLTGRGKPFRCRGVHWSIGYSSKSVTLSVPRRCLGRPAWVRVAMADGKGEGTKDYYDDSQTTSFTADGDPRFGPRVYR